MGVTDYADITAVQEIIKKLLDKYFGERYEDPPSHGAPAMGLEVSLLFF